MMQLCDNRPNSHARIRFQSKQFRGVFAYIRWTCQMHDSWNGNVCSRTKRKPNGIIAASNQFIRRTSQFAHIGCQPKIFLSLHFDKSYCKLMLAKVRGYSVLTGTESTTAAAMTKQEPKIPYSFVNFPRQCEKSDAPFTGFAVWGAQSFLSWCSSNEYFNFN